ncbi:MAG: hypothetical protein EPO35_10815, partial [Acidobacteria bacterium]
MRRLVGLVLMATLIAPALAVCAGGMQTATRSSEHDCCPKDQAALSPVPDAPTAGATCCRMSSEAARRGAIPSHELVLPSTPVETAADWLSADSERPALGRRVMPA